MLLRLDGTPIIYIVLYLISVLVISLTVHEAAHAWTALKLGDDTPKKAGRVSLNPLARLAAALGDAPLAALAAADPFARRDECAAAVAAALRGRRYADVEAAFERHGIWYERVRDFDDVLADPQAAYADVFRRVPVRDAAATLVNHPVRYDGGVPPLRHLAVDPGEDTRGVLREAGYADAEIERLVASRAVVAAGAAAAAHTERVDRRVPPHREVDTP